MDFRSELSSFKSWIFWRGSEDSPGGTMALAAEGPAKSCPIFCAGRYARSSRSANFNRQFSGSKSRPDRSHTKHYRGCQHNDERLPVSTGR